MKATEFFYRFIVLCALLGASGYMIYDKNWVFGLIVAAAAVYHIVKSIKWFSEND